MFSKLHDDCGISVVSTAPGEAHLTSLCLCVFSCLKECVYGHMNLYKQGGAFCTTCRRCAIFRVQDAAGVTSFPHDGEPTQEGVAAVEQLAQQALEGIDLSRPSDMGAAGLTPWADAAAGAGGEEGISVELLLRAGPERVRSAAGTPSNCAASTV